MIESHDLDGASTAASAPLTESQIESEYHALARRFQRLLSSVESLETERRNGWRHPAANELRSAIDRGMGKART